jgi:hypothetical protein
LKYCAEEFHVKETREFTSAIPMVSFCDIPLSSVKNHINSYGSYGIGLSKSWAKNVGLNPVLYVEKNSSLTHSILRLVDLPRDRIANLDKEDPIIKDLFLEILKVTMFCKNYEGMLKHGKINDENYRFYDEREWRFVPTYADLKKNNVIPLIWGDVYLENKDYYNNMLKDYYLKYYPSDISYVIVDDEADIPEVLSLLNEIYKSNLSKAELGILGTKIITKQQIYEDF